MSSRSPAVGWFLIPGMKSAPEGVVRDLPLQLRRPDGSELRIIGSVQHAHGVVDNRVVHHYPILLPPGVTKEEVPVGTEVFLTGSGRYTLDEYNRIVADGYCDGGCDRYFELIRGTIRTYLARPPPNEELVDRLNEWSFLGHDHPGIRVRVRSSIVMPSLESAPLPDVMWFRKGDFRGRRPLPEEVVLVIDVDEGRSPPELRERLALFAEAEIPEYWRVRARMRRMEIHREPRDGVYHSITTLSPGQYARPLAVPDASLSVSSLLSWRTVEAVPGEPGRVSAGSLLRVRHRGLPALTRPGSPE